MDMLPFIQDYKVCVLYAVNRAVCVTAWNLSSENNFLRICVHIYLWGVDLRKFTIFILISPLPTCYTPRFVYLWCLLPLICFCGVSTCKVICFVVLLIGSFSEVTLYVENMSFHPAPVKLEKFLTHGSFDLSMKCHSFSWGTMIIYTRSI